MNSDEWAALTNLEREDEANVRDGKFRPQKKRWSVFPQSPEPERVFFFPDIHFPYQDKQFLQYLDEECYAFNPTTIVIIGDLLDCYSMSDFDKDPDRKETLNDERLAAVAWLESLRAQHPQAEIIFIEGNHEERIFRQIKRYLPGLHDLPELRLGSLLHLERLKIRHFPSYGFVRWGRRVKHGESTAMHSSKAEAIKHFKSGVSGHIHRKQEYSYTTGEGDRVVWTAIGHACDMSRVDYVKGANWAQCAGRLTLHPGGDEKWEYVE